MDGDGFEWRDTDSPLDLAEAAQSELVDLCEGVGVLPVVLYYVDVVRDCEQACEGGGSGVPERGRDDV